ncbi:thiolase family protein [Sphingobium chungbukense]|uniref:Thiolase n=1 Tax=Sphingobium chungbukense TaxID=56193 RepID=A0A0M3ANM2_9SPHN|nr:thiolase family protein [Sphingobium chungbukense]KKW90139.1 thiolase [Sphingobium chungbukense]
MKQNAYVAGVGMTTFGKHLDRGLKSLAAEAISAALADAGLSGDDLEAAYMANAAGGVITGQVLIPGEVALRGMGIGHIPVINVENACASAGTALQQAASMVTFGAYDVVLACGFEKLVHPDKARTFSVFAGAVDFEDMEGVQASIDRKLRSEGIEPDTENAAARSIFMDIYATMAAPHMRKYGSTARHFAAVSAKNSRHGALNPRAQFRDVLTIEDVLNARVVADPLTLPMCSPIGDGAAAVVLVSERKAKALGLVDPVRIASSVLATGWDYAADAVDGVFEATIGKAYEEAGFGPEDIDVVELHDASAPSEVIHTEYLGICAKGEAGPLIEQGLTALGGGGRTVVNPSGGLLRKGHPIGATGLAQIVELTEQLRGQAGPRQVEGARTAIAENGGGYVGDDVGALVVTTLQR